MNLFSSVQFSCSVVSDSLQPNGLQHTRPPHPSSTPGDYSNSCSLSHCCHPTISSSVIPFSSCHQFFKAMSLLFNMLSRLIIAFLRSKHLLISWPQFPSAVILKPKKIKSLTVSIVSSSICHEAMGLDAMILVF